MYRSGVLWYLYFLELRMGEYLAASKHIRIKAVTHDNRTPFFYLGISLLVMHVKDAIRCKEWRILPGLSLLNAKVGYHVFVLAHMPLFFFIFLEEEWNEGYATECARACIDYGFKHLRLKRIIGRAMKDNIGSIKVLENIGLVFEREFDFYASNRGVFYVVAL